MSNQSGLNNILEASPAAPQGLMGGVTIVFARQEATELGNPAGGLAERRGEAGLIGQPAQVPNDSE